LLTLDFDSFSVHIDRLCGLVVRVPGSTKFSEKVLEQGPLSLVSTIEELLGRKVAAPA
jgi:hypothetical protein